MFEITNVYLALVWFAAVFFYFNVHYQLKISSLVVSFISQDSVVGVGSHNSGAGV